MTPPVWGNARALVLLAVSATSATLLVLVANHPTGTAIASQGAGSRSAARTASEAARRSVRPARISRLFGRKSFWNRPLSPRTAIDPRSTALVQALDAEIRRGRAAGIVPWISADAASTPLYRVGRREQRVRVNLERRYLGGGEALQRAFASVPIPRDAEPAVGPDGHLTVWQPSTDSLWDFYGARRDPAGWHARWGGAIRRVSRSPGYYTPRAWPGATTSWGATGSSLPVIGGTMLLAELNAGRIDHALAMNVPAARAGVFAWPAQRTDGVGSPAALPEGARLRLDPALSVRALRLPRLTAMIARAAQRYGLVVRDQTRHAVSLFGENPAQFPGSPYSRLLGRKTPGELLARFPWARLQVLKMRLCTRPPCRRR
jgi:hypothetical protein